MAEVKTALVTGGTKGIGLSIVNRLVETGWHVISASRTIGDELKSSEQISYYTLDVSKEESVKVLFAELTQKHVKLHGLVNNAARQGGAPISEQSRDDWQAYLDTNLTGAWQVIKYALPLLNKGASVVNVGSVASAAGFADRAAYCATKHGLLGMTKSLACELAPRDIRVNHLTLGSYETPGLRELAEKNEKTADDYASRQLLGRIGHPDEAADAAEFLLSERASFVTGTSLIADGGLLTKGNFA